MGEVKSKRGGARPGAGRPKGKSGPRPDTVPKAAFSLSLPAATMAAVEARARAEGVSKNALLVRIIATEVESWSVRE